MFLSVCLLTRICFIDLLSFYQVICTRYFFFSTPPSVLFVISFSKIRLSPDTYAPTGSVNFE